MVCLGVVTVPGRAAPQKRVARTTQQLKDQLLPGQHEEFDAKGPLRALDQQERIKTQLNSDLLLA